MAVTWVHGCIYGKYADAEKVYAEINSIGEKYSPQQIVNVARDESTELHKLFEWNDSIAAEKYREQQAGSIVRCLIATRDEKTGYEFKQPVRAIVSTGEWKREYQPITVVLNDKSEYENLLEEALRELSAFKRKYQNLKELECLFEAIDSLTS